MIDKLEFFIALARAEHFGRAAEECGISQPSLSAAIRQLEDQLGVVLVVRAARYQGLTPEGQRVLEWARRIVADTRTMREEMRAARKGLAGHIRLAVIPTALAMVPRLTEPFQARHPAVTFSVTSRTSLQVLGQIENLEIDAGITYLDNEPLGRVTTVPLYSERYHLIAAAGTPLADQESVTWRQVAGLRLCLLTSDMQNRRIINKHMAEAGVEVKPTLESNSMIVLFSHIRTGQWASIMPRNIAESFGFPKQIKMIPIIEPDAEHLVGLIATYREPHTPLVSALLHEARQRAAELVFDRKSLSSDGNTLLT
ncbi:MULTISPECIES: LysR family transcriptional regulator [Rhizobium/Agrobacterium group]|uniref:HTH-type transcriptional regulator TtuA n=2 Tax=Agrobacterium tumefaciens complex TaxID=1183400 RepID=A0AAE6EMH5_AGRTU|nr:MULTISPECIES: LysR family transcriptional regulator [Rhizobium/Agrobacterium group]MCA2375680.1 LysR family transcriptional regulator [Agrobacterium tomkonis RTP8]MCA2371692.1 LysR family transcriptional regulator [Agrobacterium tomkonis CIP 111-78]MCZ7454741.1 LysR family transcriptional regulator [Rhizobium rhizogenes]QCL92221.1 LysR family transcriptional regulator [Agrobacterium tumefaciens]QCM03198.1 LysR family transcriptional regulator [Agrobacterium tumefaciens]